MIEAMLLKLCVCQVLYTLTQTAQNKDPTSFQFIKDQYN